MTLKVSLEKGIFIGDKNKFRFYDAFAVAKSLQLIEANQFTVMNECLSGKNSMRK